MKPVTLRVALHKIDQSKPRAGIIYARVLAELVEARNFPLHTGDLSALLDRGRDSQAVRNACAHMESLGLVTRELVRASDEGGLTYLVRLAPTLEKAAR